MDRYFSALGRYLAFFLTIILSSAFFLTLYHYDNKYNQDAPQAINGALYVSKEDWTAIPIRYLHDGWRYYGDRLLTPETLKQQKDEFQYLSIGKESNFAMGDKRRSPHGSASYAMTLYLPKEIHTYAIEIPEVYSAYQFYINDTLKLQMGNPNINNYKTKTQSRVITFEASGKITLLLAVSDYSWLYSGLVYPPAFGEPLNLYSIRGLRFGIGVIIGTITLMLAIFTFYLGFRTRRGNNIWLFFSLCITTGIFSSYAVIHGILSMPIQPWYSIELVSGYLLTLLVIILHNRICDTEKYAQIISTLGLGVVCFLLLLYGLFAAHLTLPIMFAYSNLVFFIKLFTAIYLILTATMAVRQNRENATILLYADIIYASAFFWDILLPNYEPILGGWFQNWGGLTLVIATSAILLYDVSIGYKNSLVYAEEQWQMKRQLTMQVEHLRQMNQKVEESAKMRHDFRHHLRTLLTLSEEGHQEEMENYIRGITVINEGTRLGRLTHNVELDALIQYYNNLAQSSDIKFRARLNLPAELSFPMVDLCGLLGNLLENAVEACQRQETGSKKIFMAGQILDGHLEFIIDNSFDGELKIKGNKYLSSKRNNSYGIGITSVLETVERHSGVINLYADDKGFHAELSLPFGT